MNNKLSTDKQVCPCHPLRFIFRVVTLLAVILASLCLTSCSKSQREIAEKLAGKEPFSKIVELPAELDFDRTKIISINSPIDGKVIKVNCNQGDIIKQGDILAEIENPQTVGQIFKVNTQFHGLITRRNINPTVWVTRGSILFEVVDTSKLWGVIHVYSEETRSEERRVGKE